MNPSSSGLWDIPPPPGTEDDRIIMNSSPKLNCESIETYETQILDNEKKSSRSHDRHHKRRHSRSRSKTRYKHRRSRSKSRSSRKRRHNKSRSRSRSKSRSKHVRKERKSKHSSRSRHSSRSHHSSRSKYSKSRSRSRSRSYKSRKSHKSSRDYEEKDKQRNNDDTNELIDVKIEEEETDELEDEPPKDNAFKNDGSFLEMFKKMQEEKKAQEEAEKAEAEKQKLPAFGKRKGGRVLKTGMVLKTKPQENEESGNDAWSIYMKEVKRYKEACCDDDSKTRPLVK